MTETAGIKLNQTINIFSIIFPLTADSIFHIPILTKCVSIFSVLIRIERHKNPFTFFKLCTLFSDTFECVMFSIVLKVNSQSGDLIFL